MDINKLNQLKSNLSDEKLLLRFALITVTIIGVLNYASIQSIKDDSKIIIAPLNQTSKFWVSSNEASELYLTNLGLYVVQLWQNYTPANVEQNFAKLLELTSAQSYSKIKKQLKIKADVIKRYNRNSFSFRKTKAQINTKTKQLIITGVRTRFTKTGVKPSKKVQLIINYQINNATFSVTSLLENRP